MPSLGADMDAGTLLEWHVKPGDEVKRGDVVALVDTDKAAIEVEIFQGGVIERLLVTEGERVPVGTVLATLRSPAEAMPPPPVPTPEPARAPAPPVEIPPAPVEIPPAPVEIPPAPAYQAQPPAIEQAPPGRPARAVSPVVRRLAHQLGVDLQAIRGTGRSGAVTRADVERAASALAGPPAPAEPARPAEAPPPPPAKAPVPAPARAGPTRASPAARRRAQELGVDLASLRGSGPRGAITLADVDRATQAQRAAAPTPPAPTERLTAPPAATGSAAERQLAMRRAIAALMARSKREIPHYYLATEIDLHHSLGWLEQENTVRSVADRLLPAVLLLKAVALAVRQVPEMNGFMEADQFRPSQAVHLGVAVSLRQGGLIAPAIHDADQLSLDELMHALRDLVTRARAGRLRGSEMADPTITITNLGDQGVERVYGVIYPPQVALVGFGKITERPWAADGMVGARPIVTATLAADHRVSDGHRGGLFLAAVDRLLQQPEAL
jgi:pyruvate dehydrogenase E2 component (dihydrolipoamide acetyltransferase)